MICLDIYNEEGNCYTPYNFLDFFGFESRYNEVTEWYDVNGFVNGTVFIASFEEEELAIAVTRYLFSLKSLATINPQIEARFIDIDMIVDELEEEDEVIIEDLNETEIEEKIEEVAYCNVANKLLCVCIGLIIGFIIACLVI